MRIALSWCGKSAVIFVVLRKGYWVLGISYSNTRLRMLPLLNFIKPCRLCLERMSFSGWAEQTRWHGPLHLQRCLPPATLTLDRMPSRQLTPNSRSPHHASTRASPPSKLQRSASCDKEHLHHSQAEHERPKSRIAPVGAGYPIIMPALLPFRPPVRRSSARCRNPDALHHRSHSTPSPPFFASPPGTHADNWIGWRMANMYAPPRSISSSNRH